MRHRCQTLLLAACLAPAAFAQAGGSVATQARDSAAVFVAQGNYLISRLGAECLTLVGRAETPQALVTSWRQRNARYVSASSRYLDKRMEEAEAEGGTQRREAMLGEIRAAVQNSGESSLRTLMQGRKEEACMRAITLLDTGTLDINSKLPQIEQLDALVRWAEQ
jgi:hypothetical protein